MKFKKIPLNMSPIDDPLGSPSFEEIRRSYMDPIVLAEQNRVEELLLEALRAGYHTLDVEDVFSGQIYRYDLREYQRIRSEQMVNDLFGKNS